MAYRLKMKSITNKNNDQAEEEVMFMVQKNLFYSGGEKRSPALSSMLLRGSLSIT
jgi:hypothetical protein